MTNINARATDTCTKMVIGSFSLNLNVSKINTFMTYYCKY